MINDKVETVLVLGASTKPERFGNKAVKALLKHECEVIPVHPRHKEVEGLRCFASLEAVAEELSSKGKKLDTITLYVNGQTALEELAAMIKLSPKRVIMNPGTENEELAVALNEVGIKTVQACTLVLLNTKQWDKA